ncbi:MAG: hypothetical protein Kow0090_01840 [Myxococcota bacterium]
MELTYELPKTLEDDLKRFKDEVAKFKSGESSHAKFRSFRVPQGVYEQREDNFFMLRVRLPAGGVFPNQMRALASVARKYGNGILHVTTRQDIQVHRVPLDNLHPALVELFQNGLSTKGGGGNTVRNITACYDAGVCNKEAFDTSPYSAALTEFLLSDPLSYQLPRKYKIAFSACGDDCGGVMVNDLGFIAKKRGDEEGFAAYAGGGMGAVSRVANLLEEFIPAGEIHLVAEAVKRVFDKHGNRKNKHKARLRFLIDKIGFERFRGLYAAELSELRKVCLPPLKLRETPPATMFKTESRRAEPQSGFDKWKSLNVAPQKQPGFFLVQIPLILGDIHADTLEKLAAVVESFGEKMARTTQWQNIVIRWVAEGELPALNKRLAEIGLAEPQPPFIRNAIACAGASTCKLGLCLSRGMATAILKEVSNDGINLERLGELNLYVSGCPNACSRHPIADIGLFGGARRVNGRLAPFYAVQLGGETGEGKTKLAKGSETVPARNVPRVIADFLRRFQSSEAFPNYKAFLESEGEKALKELIKKHSYVPPFEEDKNYYYDWGANDLFSLAGKGPGECGAGVFDLIEVDIASAKEALSQSRLLDATSLAARALLVTQGEEATNDLDALKLFQKLFIETGIADKRVEPIVVKTLSNLQSHSGKENFTAAQSEVALLVETVEKLYENMDDSLRFQPQTARAEEAEKEEPKSEIIARVNREADFRGVTCPLNYVKTKMILAQLKKGELLSVLLDRQGARNVPESAEQDGHEIVSANQESDYWRVIIKKG